MKVHVFLSPASYRSTALTFPEPVAWQRVVPPNSLVGAQGNELPSNFTSHWLPNSLVFPSVVCQISEGNGRGILTSYAPNTSSTVSATVQITTHLETRR